MGEFPEEVIKKLVEKAKEILGEEVEYMGSIVHDADFREMPAIYAEDFVIYYDPRDDEVYSEYYECTDGALSDMFNLVALDPKMAGVCLPESEVEALRYYGTSFAVIVEVGDHLVKISGMVLGKVADVFIPYDDLPFEMHDELEKVVDAVMPEVFKVLSNYVNVPIDAWRSLAQSRDNAVNGFVKVVEGWVGIGERLARVERLKDDPPVVPILFVFPRSSNITVTYFDVWVPSDKKAEFMSWFGDVDEFSFSEGVYVKTVA